MPERIQSNGLRSRILKSLIVASRIVAIPLTVIACGSAPTITVQDVYNQYIAGGNNKAYAVAENGAAGGMWNAASIEQAKQGAMDRCISGGGYGCRITSVNGNSDPTFVSSTYPDSNRPTPAQTNTPPKPQNQEPKLASTSTGFFVNRSGDLLTNAHTVDECREVSIRFSNQNYPALVRAIDAQNDLALLSTEAKNINFARFSTNRRVRLGEGVIVFGFPLSSVLSSHPKITEGSISSLAGLEDDTRYFQISAPIQPGNSGGPLFDKYGQVIGVVSSKLSDSWTMKNAGVIPQNVNFALKASSVKAFLDVQNIQFSDANSGTTELSTPDLADIAVEFTAQLACWN